MVFTSDRYLCYFFQALVSRFLLDDHAEDLEADCLMDSHGKKDVFGVFVYAVSALILVMVNYVEVWYLSDFPCCCR